MPLLTRSNILLRMVYQHDFFLFWCNTRATLSNDAILLGLIDRPFRHITLVANQCVISELIKPHSTERS